MENTRTNDYRTLVRRVFAGYIDLIVCSYISTIIFILIRISVNISVSNISLFYIISFFITYSYFVITAKKFSGSFGKLYFNLNILEFQNENKIGWNQSFKRELVNIILGFCSLIPLIVYSSQNNIQTYEDMKIYQNQNIISNILSMVSIIVFILEIATALFSKKRRAIHDIIGGTVIKTVGRYKALSKTITIIFGTILFLIYISFFTHIILK